MEQNENCGIVLKGNIMGDTSLNLFFFDPTYKLSTILNAAKYGGGNHLLTEVEYDYETKNCAHYAKNIWRGLDLDESQDLEYFLLDFYSMIVDEEAYPLIEEYVQHKLGTINGFLSTKFVVKSEVIDYIANVISQQLYLQILNSELDLDSVLKPSSSLVVKSWT